MHRTAQKIEVSNADNGLGFCGNAAITLAWGALSTWWRWMVSFCISLSPYYYSALWTIWVAMRSCKTICACLLKAKLEGQKLTTRAFADAVIAVYNRNRQSWSQHQYKQGACGNCWRDLGDRLKMVWSPFFEHEKGNHIAFRKVNAGGRRAKQY
jgi:hypothetical protein